MAKRAVALLGLAEALFPGRIIRAGEWLAFESRGGATLRPWTVPLARVEGVTVASFVLAGGRRPALGRLFGLVGTAMVVFPAAVVDAALRLSYENAAEIELRPWVLPATRALGFVYLLAGLLGGFERGPSEGPRAAREEGG